MRASNVDAAIYYLARMIAAEAKNTIFPRRNKKDNFFLEVVFSS